MKFHVWLEQKGLKQSDVATALKTGKARAHRIVKEKIMPHADEMKAIYEMTGGAVTANDFYGLPDPTRKIKKRTCKGGH